MPPLWFRLDEVLPLAEHAMACVAHHRTTAQFLHGARLGPALIWNSAAGALGSNGVPGWYGADGRHHTAEAATWQHRATGRSAVSDAGADLYLPLAARPRSTHRHGMLGWRHPPLITVLRRGAKRDKHWFAVHTDPAARHRFQVLDHRGDIAEPDARWHPAMVTAEAVAHGTYPALVADGYTVYGDDVLARFDAATVRQMIADLHAMHADTGWRTGRMPGEYAVLHLDGSTVVISFEHDDGEAVHLFETDRVYPDSDGYYSVGAHLWPWHLVTN